MHEKLETGDVQVKKAYLRSVIAQIEVGDDKVRIVGEKASLAAVIAGTPPENAHARGFVRKWRARRDSNSRPSDSKDEKIAVHNPVLHAPSPCNPRKSR